MAALGGGLPPPSVPSSTKEAFNLLLRSPGSNPVPPSIPKFIKKLDSIPEIDLPSEIPIKVALALSDRGLVGQFMGLWPSTKTTDDWIQRNWRPQLKNSVTCYPVGRGFFIFEFISKEDRDLIFRNGPYFMGPQGLYLNRWTPDFNAEVDVPKEVPVWVRLPNLPVHCWNTPTLEKIGNALGKFIDKADNKGQYSCARICVEVDLEAGLPEAVKLKVGDWLYYQKLDYEQLPFKCRQCHEHGHFQRNCPKNKNSEEGEGWKKSKRGKTNGKNPEKRTNLDMQNLHANTTKPSIEGSKEDPSTIPNEHQDPNLNEKNQAKGSDEPQSSKHTNRKEAGTQIDDQLEPGEINQPLEGAALLGSPKDANEDILMLDSNPEEESDEGASSSGLYSIPPKVPRGRKSKKK